jgi:triacylglycerol lipase
MAGMTALAGPASAPEPLRVTDSAALALDYADQQLLAAVREVHQSLARRAFATTRGLSGSLPERAHAAASNSVYAGVSTAMRGSAGGLRALARWGVGAPLESSPVGRQVASILHALIGAELTAAGDTSCIRMALRDRAVDVPLEAGTIARTYPRAGNKLVLFLHGLAENDESWETRDQAGYADQLTSQTDWTPLLLRYNSGLPVSDNGAELAGLVSDLVAHWPVPVDSIALVGHSMGGLLARSTTVQAFAAGQDWVHKVTHVVCLGTPHLGAQLEKAVHLATNALNRVPRSVPFRAPRHGPRPVGLRHAHVSRDEWVGRDLTARWGEERIAIAPLAHVTYHFVAPDVDHQDSRADHVSLLQHPRIGDWLVSWLQQPQRRTDEPVTADDPLDADGYAMPTATALASG